MILLKKLKEIEYFSQNLLSSKNKKKEEMINLTMEYD